MATIERRTGKDGHLVYRVKVRRRGVPPRPPPLQSLQTRANWAKVTEGAAIEGRHFPPAEAKRHTLADLIERYIHNVWSSAILI